LLVAGHSSFYKVCTDLSDGTEDRKESQETVYGHCECATDAMTTELQNWIGPSPALLGELEL